MLFKAQNNYPIVKDADVVPWPKRRYQLSRIHVPPSDSERRRFRPNIMMSNKNWKQ